MRPKPGMNGALICLNVLALMALGGCASDGQSAQEIVGSWEADRNELGRQFADGYARGYLAATGRAPGEPPVGEMKPGEGLVVPPGEGLEATEARLGEEASDELVAAGRSIVDDLGYRVTLELRPDRTFTLVRSYSLREPAEQRSEGTWRLKDNGISLEAHQIALTGRMYGTGRPWRARLRWDEARLVQTDGTMGSGTAGHERLIFVRAANSEGAGAP